MEKIEEELAQIVTCNNWEELQNLAATRRAIQEALRLYPPAWAMSRTCLSEDTLAGYTIPKGATIFLSIYAMQRDPGYWEQPRCILCRSDFAKEYPKEAYLPFGTGPRICIGNHFALMEMQIITAILLKQSAFSIVQDSLNHLN